MLHFLRLRVGAAALLSAVIGTMTSLSALPVQAAAAPMPVTFCVFDIMGTKGDVYRMAQDYALQAARWGVKMSIRSYTDERIVAEDFKAGQCDGATISGLRGRQFNKFTGTIDSIGGVPTDAHMRELIELLANPKLATKMVEGPYEIAGIVPLGAAYVMVNDRHINSVAKASGKKVAVLDWDKSQSLLVQKMGSQPVASDITNFAGKFNNGSVDIIASPAVAFKPLELWRGLDRQGGGIYRFPLVQITGVMVIRKDKFPEGFGQKVREYIVTQLDKAADFVKKAEADIPEKYWLDIPESDKVGYIKMMRDARILLKNEGFYDPQMLKLLKKIRCKHDPSNYECPLKDEEA